MSEDPKGVSASASTSESSAASAASVSPTPAAPTAAPVTAAPAAAPAAPATPAALTFIVQHEMVGPHGESYHAGDTYLSDLGLADPVTRQLHRLGAIKMPSEVLPAEEVAAKLAYVAELEQQLADLKRMQAQGAPVDGLLDEITSAATSVKRGGGKA